MRTTMQPATKGSKTDACSSSAIGRGPDGGELRARAGACGNPAILAYANKIAPTDRPDIGYAMIFPGMTIVKILFVNIVPGFL